MSLAAKLKEIGIGDQAFGDVLANSFRDFHVKGFDYICLRRTPARTDKFYFFEGNVAQAPEVVHPHDHRYHFVTEVLAGTSSNILFRYSPIGVPMEEFEYRSKLLGGNGFTWSRSVRLARIGESFYGRNSSYSMKASEFHTIRIIDPATVLHLIQFEDVVPVGSPTKCFSETREPFNLSGLYNKFKPDEAVKRLQQIHELARRGVA